MDIFRQKMRLVPLHFLSSKYPRRRHSTLTQTKSKPKWTAQVNTAVQRNLLPKRAAHLRLIAKMQIRQIEHVDQNWSDLGNDAKDLSSTTKTFGFSTRAPELFHNRRLVLRLIFHRIFRPMLRINNGCLTRPCSIPLHQSGARYALHHHTRTAAPKTWVRTQRI